MFGRSGLLAVALVALLGLAALWRAEPAAAQGGTPGTVTQDEVNRVAKKLFCPVCENVPLDVCPTQACAQWRGTIREKLELGWSEQQILDYFVAQYGERVLAEPSTRGLNIVVWVLPPIIGLAGVVVLWQFLRRASRPRPGAAPVAQRPTTAAGKPADEYAQRLEQELRKRI
jgi:cytochrome c-type biogenesis protein CcmH